MWNSIVSVPDHWPFSAPEPKTHMVNFSIPMVRRPSVAVRRRPRRQHFQTRISLKPDGQS